MSDSIAKNVADIEGVVVQPFSGDTVAQIGYKVDKKIAKLDKGHMTLWAIYAQFSKDQNSALKLLLLF